MAYENTYITGSNNPLYTLNNQGIFIAHFIALFMNVPLQHHKNMWITIIP